MLRAAVGLALGAALVVAAFAQPPAGGQSKGKGKAKQKREPLVIPDVPRDKLVCFCLYTVHNKTLKLTAQLYPLKDGEERKLTLAIDRGDGFKPVQTKDVDPDGWLATFRVEKWDDTKPAKYRVTHAGGTSYEGIVRKDPTDKDEVVVGNLSCNSNTNRGPRDDIVGEPQGPGPGPALLRRRPELRPQGTLRGVAALRPAVRRDHQGPADGHDPGRPRRRPPATSGAPAASSPSCRAGPTAATSCRSSTSTWSRRRRPATCRTPTTRRRCNAASPSTTPGSTSAGSTSPSSKTASGRAARPGWCRRWGRGRTTSPTRTSTAGPSTCPRRNCSANGS